MLRLSRVMVAASAAALVFLPAGVALAQGAPSGGTAPAPAAAPEAKAPENKAPENTATENEEAALKKKKPAKMTRQQEIDRSVDRGTVPARYRNSIPKEYHQYIPFDKR
jgi:lipoprotein-anchoring transpeptidase ErfK/SrfK